MKIIAQESIVGCYTDRDLWALDGFVIQEYPDMPVDTEPETIMNRFIKDHPECRGTGWRYEITPT